MNYYYADGEKQVGPINKEAFQSLVDGGVITGQTMVWRDGLADWMAWHAVSSDFLGSNAVRADSLKVRAIKEGVAGLGSSDAEAIRLEYLKHESSVKSVGILYLLGSGMMLLMAVISSMALFVPQIEGLGEQERPFLVLVICFYLGLGVLYFWIGRGLRSLKNWSRVAAAVFSGLGLLAFPVGTLISAYILYLLLSAKGKMVFSDSYGEVVAATPHIKSKMSTLLWVLIIILMAVVLLGFLGALVMPLFA